MPADLQPAASPRPPAPGRTTYAKGARSRARILACAVALSREAGLEALSYGRVAAAAGLSKTAVVAHFPSRTELQAATIETLTCDFRREVLDPAGSLVGLERVRRLYAGFLDWMARGCPLSAAALTDTGLPAPLQARAARGLAGWRRILALAIAEAQDLDQVTARAEPDQLSFELSGAGLAYRQAVGSLGEAGARARAWLTFERTLQ